MKTVLTLSRRDFIRISAIGAGVLALGGLGVKELIQAGAANESSQTRALLGTYITIKLIDTDTSHADVAIDNAFAEIERLSAILSRFDPGSELAMLNRDGYIENTSPELLSILQKAKNFSALTAGAFDVTVLPLLNLFADSFADAGDPPSDKAIDAAEELVGYKYLEVKDRRISPAGPGMRVTLDGIAKGYVVDQVAALLKARGLTQVLVEADGDMSLRGMRQDGEPWKIGLTHPHAMAGYYEVLQTYNDCLATSSDYENAFTPDFLASYHRPQNRPLTA